MASKTIITQLGLKENNNREKSGTKTNERNTHELLGKVFKSSFVDVVSSPHGLYKLSDDFQRTLIPYHRSYMIHL